MTGWLALALLTALATSFAQQEAVPAAPLEEPPLEVRLVEAEEQLLRLQAEIDELNREVQRLNAEKERVERVVARLQGLYTPLEADRLLLAELRKDLPQTRREAEAYIERMRGLALRADPVRLGPLATRLVEAAPIYLEWLDQDFATTEEAAREFVQSGARGFETTYSALSNAILLTVIDRLDAILDLLDRAQ
jgi:DNA repair exonuclease SbcCD ATPase subunit